MKMCPINFKSTIRLNASCIEKHGGLQLKKVMEYAEEKHDKTVLDVVKETLNDGKDDKYKLVYGYEQYMKHKAPSVKLYKNDDLIVEKSENCTEHKILAIDVLRDFAYYKMSEAQKNQMKADFEKTINHLMSIT